MLERGVTRKFLKRLTKRQEFCLKLFKPKKYKTYLKALDREYRQMISYYVKSNSYYNKLILSEIRLFSHEVQ